MASLRSTVRIARPAGEVCRVGSDAAGISACPGIEHATTADRTRSCTLAGGHELHEDDVDVELRRFQYRITSELPVEQHRGTVDVLEDGPQGSLVVCSTEIAPDALADMVGPSIEGGVQGLKQHLEGGS